MARWASFKSLIFSLIAVMRLEPAPPPIARPMRSIPIATPQSMLPIMIAIVMRCRVSMEEPHWRFE
jgi:hypothetical protein